MADPKTRSKGQDGAPQGSTWAALRRFWPYARAHKRWLWLGLWMIPVVAAMSALRPLLVKQAVDTDIAHGDLIALRVTGILFLAAVMAEFLATAAQVYALSRAGHATITDLRRSIFGHVLKLPARFYDKTPIGNLLARSTSDIEALSETLAFGVFTILTDVAVILSILVAMFALDWRLTLVSLAAAPLLWVIVAHFSARLRALQLEIRRAQSVQSGYLAEQLAGVTVLQLFGRERAAVQEFERLGDRFLRAVKTANWYDAGLYSVMDGVSAMCVALLIYFAAPYLFEDVARSGVTLGLLFAFIDYLQRVFIPIREFSAKLATIQRAVASLERIYSLLDEPPEARIGSGADPLQGWTGGLQVRDLRFGYREGAPDVLKGIDFDIAPGEVVAVVGRTGSGKTSLGRILTRTYDGYRGSVSLQAPAGPVEVRDVVPDCLRGHVLMVQQDVFLFNDDVAFNVSLGEAGLADDPARIEAALRTVQAWDFVQERGGLQFVVGERGRNLSAGEAQLLAFARVAARQPTLLILDEATASVDSMTEHKVQAAIERLLRGRSVLVIAHRLSTVRRADKILVLQDGVIVEQGPHDVLLARGGVYAELYRMGFQEETDDGNSGAQPPVPAA
ncbi:ATP-binding cassette, subfamily B [Nannocystis exedens]|uniref:ATP-binding cassette, subfamily B n=1 Tax=Nannocystis exedens TaxID=54 RepID=A0A1I1YLW7_9BACT|nr:ABC transporter ATP-binding protein [Nannocystis exedens]PCC70311.1 HlyB/MsbA family ABC transporter [Nannocystis exedens]SFE20038.1 ATP-binding cassette, subfamily B [Nannocystis exedens]